MTIEHPITIRPTIVNEWIVHFEKEVGRKPTETAIQIAYLSYELGFQMKERGCSDRLMGREPLPFSVFEAITRSIIAGTTVAAVKCANTVAQLLFDDYMIGYSGEK